MKKKKLKITPSLKAALNPNKKEELLKIVNNKEKMNAVLELGKIAASFQQDLTISTTLEEWYGKVILLLPENCFDKEAFVDKLKELVDEYSNK